MGGWGVGAVVGGAQVVGACKCGWWRTFYWLIGNVGNCVINYCRCNRCGPVAGVIGGLERHDVVGVVLQASVGGEIQPSSGPEIDASSDTCITIVEKCVPAIVVLLRRALVGWKRVVPKIVTGKNSEPSFDEHHSSYINCTKS